MFTSLNLFSQEATLSLQKVLQEFHGLFEISSLFQRCHLVFEVIVAIR